MSGRIRGHLTYANVMATLAVFIALGGVAYAVDTVGSADVINNSLLSDDLANNRAVKSADVRDDTSSGGGLTADDLATNSAGLTELDPEAFASPDIAPVGSGGRYAIPDNAIQGPEVSDQSGVDTCTHGSTRFGEICVEADDVNRFWGGANTHCVQAGLRLPTLGEGASLATNYDVPTVEGDQRFWTDNRFVDNSSADASRAWAVNEIGAIFSLPISDSAPETVCVTTPTN